MANNQDSGRNNKKRVNDPPIYSGNTKEFQGFLARVELAMEDEPQSFVEDRAKVRFVMSYLAGDPLDWAAELKRNNDPLLDNYNNFIKELREYHGEENVSVTVANGRVCDIRQRRFGHVSEYIREFKKASRNSTFNEPAKIYMFVRGLHYKMREHLSFVNPNPDNLKKLYEDVISIESLNRRHNINEFFYHKFYHRNNDSNSQSSNMNRDDPMDVDLYRIKMGQKDTRYFPPVKSFYNKGKDSHEEEKKKGLCFLCKQPGHLQFNCPNRKRPKGVKMITKKDPRDEASSSNVSMKRIKKVNETDDIRKVREIIEKENLLNKEKTNIIEFYIKTNDIEEVKARVLIDSGSDLNFIHPEFAKAFGIKLQNIDEPFRVAGLGYGVSPVKKETEKCILRFKNHFEVIQLYALRIPDVDIILGIPWIDKHCPTNYHDSKKIFFGSGHCARHCNVSKRKRRNKKKKSKGNEVKCTNDTNKEVSAEKAKEIEEKVNEEVNFYHKRKYPWDSDSEEEKEEYVRGRRVRTINDESDSDSDYISLVRNSDNDLNNSCNKLNCNVIDKCNNNEKLNKDDELATESTN